MWQRQEVQELLRPRGVNLRVKFPGPASPPVFFIAIAFFAVLTASGHAQDLPDLRPALIGQAPDAIVNRIDTKTLIAAGQKDAIVMFWADVKPDGQLRWSGTYRGTPDSKLLEQEVQRALANGKMVPAVRNRQPVEVIFYGTVEFRAIDGKARLRVFANQQTEELKTENDFIDPQLCIGGDSHFTGFHYPDTGSPVPVSGSVVLDLSIDAAGNVQNAKVESESPPLLGFGDEALDDLSGAKFIPAFRNGKPVACHVTLPFFYQPNS
jgi:TonB family protein